MPAKIITAAIIPMKLYLLLQKAGHHHRYVFPGIDEHLHHPQIKNLFPCGEGAGYAGGIVSAAMDGERVAKAIHVYLSIIAKYHLIKNFF